MRYLDLFSKLKFVTRYSGVNMIQPERLESHIIEMCGLAFDLYSKYPEFDLNKLIYLIVIHDLDESITVDIPRPFKYSNPKFKQLFDETVKDYLESNLDDNRFIGDILNAKGNGLEGKILKILDMVQVRIKLLTEQSLGNSTLSKEVQNIENYFKSEFNNSDNLLIKKYIEYFNNLIKENYVRN